MRLVHLAHYPASYPGSFVPMLRAILLSARDRGWQVEAVLGADAHGAKWIGGLEAAGIPLRLLPLHGRRALSMDVGALLDESSKPTILHTHFTAFDVPAVVASSRRAQTAVVWHLHTAARTDLAGRLRGFAKLGLAARGADRILCVAPDLAETVVARGASQSRVRFFPNAIDAESFAQAGDAWRVAARRRVGLRPETTALLHFGRDWPQKGGDVFLRAVRDLVDGGRDITALVVDGGDEATQAADSLGLGASVAVLPVSERVQDLYAAADLFATPSRVEGMPFSMLEALASGLPVAASDIPGQAAVGRGLGACRLTPLDPGAFGEAIGALLDREPDTARRDAAEAVEHVRARYGLESWVERLLAVYDEVLPTSPT